jgi:hypothetical protein
MERAEVKSSQIASVGYDPDKRILEIEFKTGKVYQYFEVPADVYAELILAPSTGRQFNQSIKGSYRYEAVEPEEGGGK